ncbi:MAG TPA: metalloprotease PmbA [Rhodocyclaceae bacterium]|nr:metalloprotease PmbA [Rhodocyclaceae bacterium]
MSAQGFSYSRERLQALAQQVLDEARRLGATACETDVSEGFGQQVTVRRQEVETIEYNRDKGIDVIVYLGQRSGHAATTDFSPEAVKSTVAAAHSIAGFTAEDSCAGLAEADLLARDVKDPGLYFPWHVSAEEAIDIARRCEQAALDVSPLITNTEGASVSVHQSHFVSANSLGFMGGYATSRHYISCSAIAGTGDDMQRDDWYSGQRDPLDLAAPEVIGDYAARRTLARLGARKLKTRKVPVLLEAPLATGLIGSFVHAASGGALYRKSSFLLDALGKRIFPEFMRISERPHIAKGLASSPFDDDGVATRDREVVEDGILQGYFLSTYSGRKLGMPTTGNSGGSHNLLIESGPLDLPGLLKKMGTGLLVTELLGHGINYVNGDYSRGAAGYWVEKGEIAYPVHEVTIAGNLQDMFRGIVAIGNDVVARGSKQCGSILIERMTVAGG